jgi:hypothetical protein
MGSVSARRMAAPRPTIHRRGDAVNRGTQKLVDDILRTEESARPLLRPGGEASWPT